MHLVHEFTVDDLLARRAPSGWAELLRFRIGRRDRHVPRAAVQHAAWIALNSDAVEVIGSGPGAEWFATALRQEIDQQRRAAAS